MKWTDCCLWWLWMWCLPRILFVRISAYKVLHCSSRTQNTVSFVLKGRLLLGDNLLCNWPKWYMVACEECFAGFSRQTAQRKFLLMLFFLHKLTSATASSFHSPVHSFTPSAPILSSKPLIAFKAHHCSFQCTDCTFSSSNKVSFNSIIV